MADIVTDKDIGKYCSLDNKQFGGAIGRIEKIKNNHIEIKIFCPSSLYHNKVVTIESPKPITDIYNYTWDDIKDDFDNMRVAINCETESESNEFLEFLDKKEYGWGYYGKPQDKKNVWYTHFCERTCYCISLHNNCVGYDNIRYFQVHNYKIIKYSDVYFNNDNCTVKTKDKWKMGNDKYEIVRPFTLFDLYHKFDYTCRKFQEEFYNFLNECTYKNTNFTINHKFTTFNKESIPEVLWENRKHLEEKGFIKKKISDPILKPGMKIKNIYTGKSYNIIGSDYGYLYLTPDCGKDFSKKVYVLNHQIKKGCSLTDLNNLRKIGDFLSDDFNFEICED